MIMLTTSKYLTYTFLSKGLRECTVLFELASWSVKHDSHFQIFPQNRCLNRKKYCLWDVHILCFEGFSRQTRSVESEGATLTRGRRDVEENESDKHDAKETRKSHKVSRRLRRAILVLLHRKYIVFPPIPCSTTKATALLSSCTCLNAGSHCVAGARGELPIASWRLRIVDDVGSKVLLGHTAEWKSLAGV